MIRLVLLLLLSLVIIICASILHLLGHYWAARIFKVPLVKASFGIGPKLIRIWNTGLSQGMIRIPLIYCEDLVFSDPDPGQEKFAWRCAFWRRACVIAGGPLLSFIFIIGLFTVISAAGTEVVLPIVGRVLPESPAEVAGLKHGDRVLAFNGHPIESWNDLTYRISDSSAGSVQLVLQRDAAKFSVTVRPEISADDGENRPIIGISPSGAVEVLRPPLWKAPLIGITGAGRLMVSTVQGVWREVGRLSSGRSLTAVTYVGKDETNRSLKFMLLIAVLSVNFVFSALIPLPIFDGGHMIYLLIETVRGKPVSVCVKKSLRLCSIGLVLLFCVLVNLHRLWAFQVL